MNIFYLIIATVAGLIAGFFFGKRKSIASPFGLDSKEGDKLRSEARKSVHARIKKRKDKIMEKAVKNGRITNDGVEDLFCISHRTASTYLKDLVKENKLKKIGKSGRGVYYTPTNN